MIRRLSRWESTLRDDLGVFKRLKKGHWRILYREYERRGKRPFDLFAGDDLVYPWQKVWKELRRNRNMALPRGEYRVILVGDLLEITLLVPFRYDPSPRAEYANSFASWPLASPAHHPV